MNEHRRGYGERKTKEVFGKVGLWLDEPGNYKIDIKTKKDEPGLGLDVINIFEHMFQQIYHHGLFGGYVDVEGKDITHHTLEDGLAYPFGSALSDALGDRNGIKRFGSLTVYFEGSLAVVAIDYSGRPDSYLNFNQLYNKSLARMAEHVFDTIAREAKFNLYAELKTVKGMVDDHQLLEAFSKCFGRNLNDVTRIYSSGIPSTKGIIDK